MTNYPYDGTVFTGGVETATAGLLEGLRAYAEEFDFHVLALAHGLEDGAVEQREGMTFHFIPIPSAWYARPHIIPNVIRARAELKKLQPDLVHCQDNMALALGAIMSRHRKMLFTVHGIKSVESRVWQGPEYWSHQMDALLERWVRQRFDEVITISPYVDRFLPIHVRKHHITNPVRKMFFSKPQSGGASRQLLFVGVLTQLKRPMDVLRAFAAIRASFHDATLTMVGVAEDPAYYDEMQKFLNEKELRGVQFLGRRSQEEVMSLMRSSGALILSSIQENTPMVIAEAMASGLPVIASRVGGVPIMVEHGRTGLLFDAGDTESLAQRVCEIFENDKLRQRLSQAGREKAVATYSAEAVASATAEVYRNLLKG